MLRSICSMRLCILPAVVILLLTFSLVIAQPNPTSQHTATTRPARTQAQLEADFAKMLSGATLEGSFTSDRTDQKNLSSDKYTLGEVKKLVGNAWLINARIGEGGKETVYPLPLPIEWAGDTPVIIVDNLTIPGMGTFSARVMFFDGHYSGYWKHGERGGNLFGVIHSADEKKSPATVP